MKKLLRSFRALPGVCLSLLFLVAFTPTVLAAQPSAVPVLDVSAPGLGVATQYTPDKAAFNLAPDGKSWELTTPGSILVPGAPWLTVQDLKYNLDPLIYGSVLVQNNTAVSQTFTIGFSIPTTLAAPNLIRGSIATSVVGTDGLISALTASSIYSGQIDGNTVKTLQAFPFTLSTPQSAVSSTAQFGFDPNNVAVNSDIGIVLKFQLSPGDTASILSDFEVAVVPEPGSAALLLLGGALLVWRRQRR